MEVSPGLVAVERMPATSGGGLGARGSPATIEQAIWCTIDAGVSFRACQGSLEQVQRLTGASKAAGEALDGGRRRQRAAHGWRAPLAMTRPEEIANSTATSLGRFLAEELGCGGLERWIGGGGARCIAVEERQGWGLLL